MEKKLLNNNQTRWLDLGSSINDKNKQFHFADLYPLSEAPESMKNRYFQIDISKKLTDEVIAKIGKFDFIRMQHVFEHFTYEDADIVLENCSKLMNDGGFLLLTVPDLEIFVKRYKRRTLDSISSFSPWAEKRISKHAAQADYFSVFAHSLLHQKHLWCYDKNGLIAKIEKSGKFENTKKLSVLNSLAGIPFTHNRVEEDLCVIATKKVDDTIL